MNYKSRKFVDLHVIDSLDEKDFAAGKTDAAMLKERLGETNINIVPHVARDVESFTAVLSKIADYREMYAYPRKAIPYLHIGCHGEKGSLVLTGGQKITWLQLSDLLYPLQEKTDYNVPLSLSSCWGYHGAGLAYVIDTKYRKRRPFYSLVGPSNEECPTPLCDAFARFYRHLLLEFEDTAVAVKLANAKGEVQLDFTRGSILADTKPFAV